jgi:hypothetical protein
MLVDYLRAISGFGGGQILVAVHGEVVRYEGVSQPIAPGWDFGCVAHLPQSRLKRGRVPASH